jgi:hypothetical protein
MAGRGTQLVGPTSWEFEPFFKHLELDVKTHYRMNYSRYNNTFDESKDVRTFDRTNMRKRGIKEDAIQ